VIICESGVTNSPILSTGYGGNGGRAITICGIGGRVRGRERGREETHYYCYTLHGQIDGCIYMEWVKNSVKLRLI